MAQADLRDGELTDEEFNQLDAITGSFNHKVDVLCQLSREDDSEVAVRQSEIDRLMAEVDRLRAGVVTAKNRAKRRKDYIQTCMEQAGLAKVKTDLFLVYTQANPPSAECVIPLDKLPERFLKVAVSADTVAAVKHWKETGEKPDGFEIRQGQHLRIK